MRRRPSTASSRNQAGSGCSARPIRRGGSPYGRELIRLDTFAIKKKALAEYKKAERALALLKDQVKRYHEQDRPGFRAWVHQQFGALLTRQRELAQAYADKCALIYEIQELCDLDGLSELEAYRKVIWRRAHPLEAEAEDRKRHEENRKRARQAPFDEEDEDPNLDWNAEWDRQDQEESFDSIPDDEWDEFSDFHETVTGRRPAPRTGKKKETPDGKSAKELYRTIVRRLHPDHHGAMTEARKNLWHEAQEAYRRRDVSALYNILARCDDGEAGLGHHSPVSLIQRLTRQLKKACQVTRREVGQIKRDVAWDYGNRVQNPRFSRQVKSDIEDAIRHMQADLRELEETLAEFERLAQRPMRSPGKPRAKRRGGFDPRQEELF